MHYRIVMPPHIGAAQILKQTLGWLKDDKAMQSDRARLSKVCCSPSKYGPQALAIGTTVKPARALWIVPVSSLTAAYVSRTHQTNAGAASITKVKVPWFIFLFVGASVLSTYLPGVMEPCRDLNLLGKAGLTATLFLIGTSLSKSTLKSVGTKPLLQGVILWVIVGMASLAAIFSGLISI